MTDTPARLVRLAQQLEDQHAPQHMTILMRNAAEEIDQLYANGCVVDKADAWDAIAAKNAEIERLRAALRDIHAAAGNNHLIANIARAALGEKA